MTERDETSETDGRRRPRLRIAHWIGLAVGTPLAIIVVALMAVVTLGITLDLSGFRERIEAVASRALERQVAIEGPVTLLPSLSPTVEIAGLVVANPEGWPEGELLRLDRALAQLGLLPLLSGEVRIDEITVQGLAVNLAQNAEGEGNWLVGPRAPDEQVEDAKTQETEEAATDASAERQPPALRFLELGALSLTDIVVTFRDEVEAQTYEARFEEIAGSALDHQPLALSVAGALQQVPYTLSLEAGSLASLIERDEPWQVTLSAVAAGLTLTIEGEIAEPLRGQGIALEVRLEGQDLEELETILKTDLPPFGSFLLAGRVERDEGGARIEELQGRLGATELSGRLEVDRSGAKPRLGGVIDIPVIDVAPLTAGLDAAQAEGAAAPKESRDVAPNKAIDPDLEILTLDPLRNFDADFTLTIGMLDNSALALRDASLQVIVQDGALSGPLRATVAEVPFRGELSLAPKDGTPAIEASLKAAKSDIGGLLDVLAQVEGIEGGFESAELAFSAEGTTMRSLVKSTHLRFALAGAELAYGGETSAIPIDFTLERLEMDFPASAESRIAAQGTLLKEPFALTLNGGTFIENFVERAWPIALVFSGSGAVMRLDGFLSNPEEGAPTEVAFALAGDRIGDLATWLGVAPEAEGEYDIAGLFTAENRDIEIRLERARIGETAFQGALGIREEEATPINFVALAFDVIDVDALADLLPKRDSREEEDSLTIDVPIIPGEIELVDSDIDLTVGRIALQPRDVTNVSFSARIREGFMNEAPLSAAYAGAKVDGTLSADLRGEVPSFALAARSADLDVGGVLAQLGVARDLDMKAGRFDLALDMKGASLRAILRRSAFTATIRDGAMRLRDPNTGGSLEIAVAEGRFAAPVGQPIALTIDGRIAETPVEIALETDSLASFAEPKTQLRARLEVALAGAELALVGTAPRPVAQENLQFALDLQGDRLDSFDELLGVSLPPYGPYRLEGAFGTRESGYYIEDMTLQVGRSRLVGDLALDTLQSPPRLEVGLDAESIQLDDFDTGDRSAEDEEPAVEAAEDEEAPGAKAARADDLRELLSPEVMRSLNGKLTLAVREVLSGQDRLGEGRLEAALEAGKLSLDPIAISIPGGNIDVGFSLEPTETDFGLTARAAVEDFDYGVLARRLDPEETTGGLIDVEVDLATRGPSLPEVMAGANGSIGFNIRPRDLEAGIFDLWAVNLFTAVLPSLDSEVSVVNCLVARFSLEDGVMRPDALLVDTTRIQASGDGTIDFRTNEVDFTAAPRSKRPQFFSARTPIRVQGEFKDFEVGLREGALIGTVFRMVTSPIITPFDWIFTSSPAADGSVACQEAWEGGVAP